VKDYPIKLGTVLFTMVQPHAGHEVEYNRWYERDHFYSGCMIGAYTFAGQRWVATRGLKELRYPQRPSPITPDPAIGSYLGLYWVLAGHHDEWNRWSVDQVTWLHANGRMFAARDHIHTLLYNYEWGALADPDGPSVELALDHRYPGLAVTVAEASDARPDLEAWYREQLSPAALAASGVGQVVALTPRPLLDDAPGDVPRAPSGEQTLMLLWFLNRPADEAWAATFAGHSAQVEDSGHGRLVWASPFLPTVPGTDRYTDEL